MNVSDPERGAQRAFAIATVSKYPPYVSGHASQAFWNNRAMAQRLDSSVVQISYCGPIPDAFVRDEVEVHHVAVDAGANPKSPDGHLIKAVAGTLVGLAEEQGLDAVIAMYADPHALMALSARRALQLRGQALHVAVSVEGSDLTDSICSHLDDGEGLAMLADVCDADSVFTVSHAAAQMLLSALAQVADSESVERLRSRLVVRHPGLPPEYFDRAASRQVNQWRSRLGIPPYARVVSSQMRLVVEKGPDVLLDLAERAVSSRRDDLFFVLAGAGPLLADLAERAEAMGNCAVVANPDPDEARVMRSASAMGIFPSRPIAGWTETFGIAPLEYQALGVPVLVSDLPAFEESCAPQMPRVGVGETSLQWWSALESLLPRAPELAQVAREFARPFTAASSADVMLDAIAGAGAGAGAAPRMGA